VIWDLLKEYFRWELIKVTRIEVSSKETYFCWREIYYWNDLGRSTIYNIISASP
jgi:hypothetical protein